MDANNIVTLALYNSNEIFWGTKCNIALKGVIEHYINNVGCENINPQCHPFNFEDCGKPTKLILTPISSPCTRVTSLTITKKQTLCVRVTGLTVTKKQSCPTTYNLVVTSKNILL